MPKELDESAAVEEFYANNSITQNKVSGLANKQQDKVAALGGYRNDTLLGMEDADTLTTTNTPLNPNGKRSGREVLAPNAYAYDAIETSHAGSDPLAFVNGPKGKYKREQPAYVANLLGKNVDDVTSQDMIDVANQQQIQKLSDLGKQEGEDRWIAPLIRGVEATNLTGHYKDEKGNAVEAPLNVGITSKDWNQTGPYKRELMSYGNRAGDAVTVRAALDPLQNVHSNKAAEVLNSLQGGPTRAPGLTLDEIHAGEDSNNTGAWNPINLAKVAAADLSGFAADMVDVGFDAVGKGVQKVEEHFGETPTNEDLGTIGKALGFNVDGDGQLRHYWSWQDKQSKDGKGAKETTSQKAFDNLYGVKRDKAQAATKAFSEDADKLWQDNSKSTLDKVTGTLGLMVDNIDALPTGIVDSISFMATMSSPAGIMRNIAVNANDNLEKRLAKGEGIKTAEGHAANIALATVSTLAEFAGDKLALGLRRGPWKNTVNAELVDKAFSFVPDAMKEKFAARMLTGIVKVATKGTLAGGEEFTTEGFQAATGLIQERLEKDGYSIDNVYKLMDEKSRKKIRENAFTGMQLGIGHHTAGAGYNALAGGAKEGADALLDKYAAAKADTDKQQVDPTAPIDMKASSEWFAELPDDTLAEFQRRKATGEESNLTPEEEQHVNNVYTEHIKGLGEEVNSKKDMLARFYEKQGDVELTKDQQEGVDRLNSEIKQTQEERGNYTLQHSLMFGGQVLNNRPIKEIDKDIASVDTEIEQANEADRDRLVHSKKILEIEKMIATNPVTASFTKEDTNGANAVGQQKANTTTVQMFYGGVDEFGGMRMGAMQYAKALLDPTVSSDIKEELTGRFNKFLGAQRSKIAAMHKAKIEFEETGKPATVEYGTRGHGETASFTYDGARSGNFLKKVERETQLLGDVHAAVTGNQFDSKGKLEFKEETDKGDTEFVSGEYKEQHPWHSTSYELGDPVGEAIAEDILTRNAETGETKNGVVTPEQVTEFTTNNPKLVQEVANKLKGKQDEENNQAGSNEGFTTDERPQETGTSSTETVEENGNVLEEEAKQVAKVTEEVDTLLASVQELVTELKDLGKLNSVYEKNLAVLEEKARRYHELHGKVDSKTKGALTRAMDTTFGRKTASDGGVVSVGVVTTTANGKKAPPKKKGGFTKVEPEIDGSEEEASKQQEQQKKKGVDTAIDPLRNESQDVLDEAQRAAEEQAVIGEKTSGIKEDVQKSVYALIAKYTDSGLQELEDLVELAYKEGDPKEFSEIVTMASMLSSKSELLPVYEEIADARKELHEANSGIKDLERSVKGVKGEVKQTMASTVTRAWDKLLDDIESYKVKYKVFTEFGKGFKDKLQLTADANEKVFDGNKVVGKGKSLPEAEIFKEHTLEEAYKKLDELGRKPKLTAEDKAKMQQLEDIIATQEKALEAYGSDKTQAEAKLDNAKKELAKRKTSSNTGETILAANGHDVSVDAAVMAVLGNMSEEENKSVQDAMECD